MPAIGVFLCLPRQSEAECFPLRGSCPRRGLRRWGRNSRESGENAFLSLAKCLCPPPSPSNGCPPLACGLGHGLALDVHWTSIHYQTALRAPQGEGLLAGSVRYLYILCTAPADPPPLGFPFGEAVERSETDEVVSFSSPNQKRPRTINSVPRPLFYFLFQSVKYRIREKIAQFDFQPVA